MHTACTQHALRLLVRAGGLHRQRRVEKMLAGAAFA
jgi:hypothetical protein